MRTDDQALNDSFFKIVNIEMHKPHISSISNSKLQGIFEFIGKEEARPGSSWSAMYLLLSHI